MNGRHLTSPFVLLGLLGKRPLGTLVPSWVSFAWVSARCSSPRSYTFPTRPWMLPTSKTAPPFGEVRSSHLSSALSISIGRINFILHTPLTSPQVFRAVQHQHTVSPLHSCIIYLDKHTKTLKALPALPPTCSSPPSHSPRPSSPA